MVCFYVKKGKKVPEKLAPFIEVSKPQDVPVDPRYFNDEDFNRKAAELLAKPMGKIGRPGNSTKVELLYKKLAEGVGN